MTKQLVYIAVGMHSGWETFHAIPVYWIIRHTRSTNFKALNLHVTKQSPQAAHLSGYLTMACISVSSVTISNTWRVHLLMQRRHPVQLFSTTQITLFLFFRLRCKLPKIHNKTTIPILIYTTFITYDFYK
ncbi:MAG: hypothetical protein LBS46_02590 [Dysgonamonadaceae bacterium]|nr:hypothetical protein [Dysgonamonadaceae bacterium]